MRSHGLRGVLKGTNLSLLENPDIPNQIASQATCANVHADYIHSDQIARNLFAPDIFLPSECTPPPKHLCQSIRRWKIGHPTGIPQFSQHGWIHQPFPGSSSIHLVYLVLSSDNHVDIGYRLRLDLIWICDYLWQTAWVVHHMHSLPYDR